MLLGARRPGAAPARRDRVPAGGAARLHQARWREAKGFPTGTQPIKPPTSGRPVRPVGSRLPLDFAVATGANFLTDGARAAATARARSPEAHQSFDHQGLWADLLSSQALACNLFGDLAADAALATHAVRRWWPETPGTVREIRFSHSPGRFDPEYLNSLRSFAAAIVLDLPDGTSGILVVDTRYHEWMKPEIPKPANLRRNVEAARRSGVFHKRALELASTRSPLAVNWLEHLLLLSMLQHPSGRWTWGRYVIAYPAANAAVAEACGEYRDLLTEPRHSPRSRSRSCSTRTRSRTRRPPRSERATSSARRSARERRDPAGRGGASRPGSPPAGRGDEVVARRAHHAGLSPNRRRFGPAA